jgi:hypothetical protein
MNVSMIKGEDINFGDNLTMTVFIEGLKSVQLVLSDDLNASEEELTNNYKDRIARFLNEWHRWNGIVFGAAKEYVSKRNDASDIEDLDIELMAIYVLFEQNEPELYGLGYWIKHEEEHGCGIKIHKQGNEFKIVEIGAYDVAFC